MTAGDRPLERGMSVGRYVVLRRRGAGGMRDVYTAYDRVLDRKVAVELLDAAGDPDGNARLLQEARVLARIDHANVVTVHDVGEHEGRVWIAMELVDGQTLGEWCREQSRARSERLAVLRAAGEGLAAIHAAGLVHRGFDSDTVMIGRDGRVRVTDLALVATEKLAGGSSHARSDQLAFCVTAWETLFGRQPQEGDTPERSGVPTWLRHVLARGLRSDPGERWPSIEVLLAELSRAQRRVRVRGWAAVGTLALVTAGSAWGWQHLQRARALAACAEQGATIDDIWNDEARERVHAGLLATGVNHAATTFEKVVPWFDDGAAKWRVAREQACRHIDIERDWDADTAVRANECLDRARAGFEAQIVSLAEADDYVLTMAGQWAARVVNVEPCLDPAMLALRPLPPADPTMRAALENLNRSLADVWRLDALGRGEEAYALARERLAIAEALGVPTTTASCRLTAGEIASRTGHYDDAREMLQTAYFEGTLLGSDPLGVEAAQMLAALFGIHLRQTERGLRWGRHAEVLLSRMPASDGVREAAIWNTVGMIQAAAGRHDEALVMLERARATLERNFGPAHPHVAETVAAIAISLDAIGEFDRASQAFAEALAAYESAYGPEHPETALALEMMAWSQFRHDAYEAAENTLRRAIEIRERASSRDPTIVSPLIGLARIRSQRGDHGDAKLLLERARRIVEASSAPENSAATVWTNLGRLHTARGERADALVAHERALEVFERLYGPDHPDVAHTLVGLGDALIGDGRRAEGVARLERAIETLEKGAKGYELADARFVLARALWTAADDRPRSLALARQAAEDFQRIGAPIRRQEVRTWLMQRDASEN